MAAPDTTSPVLTSLVIPTVVDITNGSTSANFTLGATDIGSGVQRAFIALDHSYRGQYITTSYVNFDDGFINGTDKLSNYFSSATAAGTYNITGVYITDNAGNTSVYYAPQLTSMGISTSFQVVDHNLTPTVTVTAPTSVREGANTSIPIDLTLKNVSTASGSYTLSVDTLQTTTSSAVVSVPTTSASYSISQSPTGNYVLHLPSITLNNDGVAEGTRVLALKITASGQVFDTGSDTTPVKILVTDNGSGTSGNDVMTGGAGNDTFYPAGGRDIVDGGAGTDTIVLTGTRASYKVLTGDGYTFLMGADGSGVRVANVEKVQFADGTVDWSSVAANATAIDGLKYLASYGDLQKALGTNASAAVDHFVNSGFFEGRSTGTFDPLDYIASNPDLIKAFGTNSALAEQHYLTNGIKEGRSATSFDAREYIASNPDLIKAFGDNPLAGEQHYITNGFNEHRPTTSFNALEYLASNPDLIKAFGDNPAAATEHYIANGYNENRATTSFDALKYIASYPDLIKAFGEDVVSATKHYIDNGYAEGRTASFNALLYAASNTDLAKAFGTNQVAAEQHYIDHGYAEGRPTSGFDSVAYALTYQDLGKSGLTIDQDLIHWLTNGAKEGRVGDSLYGREQTNHAATIGGTTHDTLGTTTDHDWFQATLSAGQTLNYTLAATTFDPLLQIFDDHGVLVTQVQGATTGSTASLSFAASKSGTYYFGVSATDAHTGDYDLAIKFPSIPLQAREIAADAPAAAASAPLPSTDHVAVQAIGTAAVDHSDYEMMLHHHGG